MWRNRRPHIKFERPHLKVEQPNTTFAQGNAEWTNKDLDPVPRHERKWGPFSFISYWISDAFNPSTWQIASGILAVGLTWRESLVIVALGFFIISIVIALNGAVGVLFHAPFPVLARASYGFRGSYLAIVSRLIPAIFWFAIQTMNGANCVRVMLGAIFPSFLRLPNRIPEDQGITTNTMVSFFLYWLIQLPFLCMRPNTLRWLFAVKTVIVPITWIGILIWAFSSTGGGALFDQRTASHGSSYSWAFIASLTTVIGNFATLSVNQADFSRYSRVSAKWQLLYVPLLPLIFTFISFIGVAASSAGEKKYGVLDWDPMGVISNWENRGCRFVAAFSFTLATLGVNISANSVSAANDLMSLSPRYINIRRGQLLCAVFAWVLVPWRILSSAAGFLNFMSAYSIFMGPVAAIMVMDFWVIHRGKYHVSGLYHPWNMYRYWHGVNRRAVIAFAVGVIPSLPGFVHSVNSKIPVGAGAHPYQFGWMLGFVSTSIVYLTLSVVFRAKLTYIDHAVYPDDIYDINEEPTEVMEIIRPKDEEEGRSLKERKGLSRWGDKILRYHNFHR